MTFMKLEILFFSQFITNMKTLKKLRNVSDAIAIMSVDVDTKSKNDKKNLLNSMNGQFCFCRGNEFFINAFKKNKIYVRIKFIAKKVQ